MQEAPPVIRLGQFPTQGERFHLLFKCHSSPNEKPLERTPRPDLEEAKP